MTPGKVESAGKLLKGGIAPRDVAQISASRSLPCIVGSPPRVGEPSGEVGVLLSGTWESMKDEVTSILSAVEQGDPRAAE